MGSRRGGEEESVMNFVPGEEREGKMRIIHKEQVVVIAIIAITVKVKSCIKIIFVRNDCPHLKTFLGWNYCVLLQQSV